MLASFRSRVIASLGAAVAVVCFLLGPDASASAATPGPFREVLYAAHQLPGVASDGVRFAWVHSRRPFYDFGDVRVFDTLRGRSFRLTPPKPSCRIGAIGGGSVRWGCPTPETSETLITDLATGRSREPAGIEQVTAMDNGFQTCRPGFGFGLYWMEIWCGLRYGGGGGASPCCFLNHRTGELRHARAPLVVLPPSFDPDYAGLVRPWCPPLGRAAAELGDYQPPFGLETPGLHGSYVTAARSIRLLRCGTRRPELLSRCRSRVCRTPQLGSRYVTWGEQRRVYAYLPRIRRRVLLGRVTGRFVRGHRLIVAHTCNRVFVRWGFSVYAARFEPRRGAPPCQSGVR